MATIPVRSAHAKPFLSQRRQLCIILEEAKGGISKDGDFKPSNYKHLIKKSFVSTSVQHLKFLLSVGAIASLPS
jgi:hypothetical protein